MRILHVSDLHYALPQLDWVVGVADEFDLVVMAGDHLNLASAVPLEAQAVVVLEYLRRLHDRTRVVASSGNHDLTGPDGNGEQCALWLVGARGIGVPVDHQSVTVDDTLVTVCPWWDGPVGRDAVEALLARDAERRPRRWVWVYHWPPVGSPTCWTGKRSYGDDELGGWISRFRPDVVLTGHVHQPPFRADGAWADRIDGAWVFNPGQQSGPVPAHIEVDLDEGWAGWASLAGREELSLDAAAAPPRTAV